MNQALHNAVIDLLNAETGLLWFSQVPQDQARPYGLVADASGDHWDTSDSDGAKVGLDLVIVSDYKGTKEVLHFCDLVDTALGDGTPLNLSGAAVVVDLWSAPPSVDILDDGRTTRATVRVTVLLDDIAPTTA